ncbi:MAG TPA: hypothetical protein VMB27_20370 [Solirubrobacteraceae bacterium]|nr:hypothetical protein [Solirubrobacteraceae bacterium]
MKSWMLPWLLPVGMLGAVVFVSIFDNYSALAALVLLGVALPVFWRVRFPARDDPDADVNYWRIRRR